jgi:hypothetical protein
LVRLQKWNLNLFFRALEFALFLCEVVFLC